MLRTAILLACMLGSSAWADAPPVPAFPGAEGFGAVATGGRGGTVAHVTNLDDAGPGSLRDAVSQAGRIVVFDVGGIIRTRTQLVGSSNLTIAGQTAPGEGVTIYGPGISFSGKTNVIVRHLRLRGAITNPRGSKQLNVADAGSRMIFDHLSISWGRWDNLGFTERASEITLQDCIVGEAIDPQRFGALIDSADRISVVRNLWIDNQSRNPKGKANMQYVNNVVYNWGGGGGYGGGHSGAPWAQDLIGNVFIAGPSSTGAALGGFAKTDHVFASANVVDLDRDGTLDALEAAADAYRPMGRKYAPPTRVDVAQNKPVVAVTVMRPTEAFDRVVANAGASLHRDAHDLRMIEQVNSFGKKGAIIEEESAVGGIGRLMSASSPPDADRDGMPDEWEKAHKLDPNDPIDAMKINPKTGYAVVESYVNSLAK
jgi:hypothetical protein